MNKRAYTDRSDPRDLEPTKVSDGSYLMDDNKPWPAEQAIRDERGRL
jgi:hypothetical protein